MPMSVAATVMRASSPELKPATLMGTTRQEPDFTLSRAVGRADLQAIAAPVDLGLDLGRCAGRGVGRAGGDAARVGLGLEVPRAVAAVPLPAVLEAHQLPFEALGVGDLAVGAEHDGLEPRRLAFLGLAALEQRLDADAGRLEVDGQRDGALDRAPAGLPELQDYVGFQRPA